MLEETIFGVRTLFRLIAAASEGLCAAGGEKFEDAVPGIGVGRRLVRTA